MTALLSSLAPYLIAAIGAFGFMVAAYARGRVSGARIERTKQVAQEQLARDVSDQVDNDVGAMPPKDAREELKRWQRLLNSR
jgi:hypothetical protein